MTADSREVLRGLVRQSLIHHRKREEQLEQMLADLIAAAAACKCKCRACKHLRHLARELT